jgi:hypothetical protein
VPVRLPPGLLKLATSPSLTGSKPITNTTGIVVVAFFAACAERRPPVAAITAAPSATSSVASASSSSRWPSAHHIATLDEALIAQAGMESLEKIYESARRAAAEKPNHRHCRLLCAPRERPRRRRATEERDELSSPYAEHGDFLPCTAPVPPKPLAPNSPHSQPATKVGGKSLRTSGIVLNRGGVCASDRCPLWVVKSGKARGEHIASGLPPIVLQNSLLRCEHAIIESK